MKPPKLRPIILDVINSDALRRGTMIILDLADDEAAMRTARKIADATGCAVTVRDSGDLTIGRIASATRH